MNDKGKKAKPAIADVLSNSTSFTSISQGGVDHG
jgi:hypothetical protein